MNLQLRREVTITGLILVFSILSTLVRTGFSLGGEMQMSLHDTYFVFTPAMYALVHFAALALFNILLAATGWLSAKNMIIKFGFIVLLILFMLLFLLVVFLLAVAETGIGQWITLATVGFLLIYRMVMVIKTPVLNKTR